MPLLLLKKFALKYVLLAMLSWVPLSSQIVRNADGTYPKTKDGYFIVEDKDEAMARYEMIAGQIIDVAFDEDLKPLFNGSLGRLKTALLLASIGSFEGGFHKFVVDGDCNKPGWKSDKGGTCDGGAAFSTWQIHISGGGYLIKDGELTQVQYERQYAKDNPEEVIDGALLIRDPSVAARLAYFIVHYSTKNFHGLCAYTGENCVTGHHPLALAREGRAVDYLRNHPFDPSNRATLPVLDPGEEEAVMTEIPEGTLGLAPLIGLEAVGAAR
jgi:hypothetical protein